MALEPRENMRKRIRHGELVASENYCYIEWREEDAPRDAVSINSVRAVDGEIAVGQDVSVRFARNYFSSHDFVHRDRIGMPGFGKGIRPVTGSVTGPVIGPAPRIVILPGVWIGKVKSADISQEAKGVDFSFKA
eukprot:Em0001g3198a